MQNSTSTFPETFMAFLPIYGKLARIIPLKAYPRSGANIWEVENVFLSVLQDTWDSRITVK